MTNVCSNPSLNGLFYGLISTLPVLSSLLSIPTFDDCDESKTKEESKLNIQNSAIEHINASISYQQNIENALQILTDKCSAKWLQKSLELLETDKNDKYGLRSKILSQI